MQTARFLQAPHRATGLIWSWSALVARMTYRGCLGRLMLDDNSTRKRGVFRVAENAGVSIATVSRTFNEPDLVREDVRKRVIEAAVAIGYVPNSAAKALRLRRTHIVGAVIPTLDHAIYAKLVNALQAQLASDGYTVIVLTVGFDNSRIHDRVKQVVERGAEALVIVGKVEDDELLHFLRIKGTPWVQTYSFDPGTGHAAVGFDNGEATARMVEHLLELGHREFAMIAGPIEGNDRQISRVEAFRARLAEHCIEAAPVIEKSYSLLSGIEALEEIRARYPETTAIVCNSDILAFGVLYACRRASIAVPGQISVTGFDDLDFAALMDPPLTTVAIEAERMGRVAGERIAAALSSRQPIEGECLPTQLIVRGSTAPPRSAAL